MHWYGGLNTHNLDNSHNIAPEKFLLATEACNCPGVMYEATNPEEWWNRAEHLGMGARCRLSPSHDLWVTAQP